jgi:hypothetical protein
VPQGVLCKHVFHNNLWSWVEITHLCHPLHNTPVRSFFSPPRDPSPAATVPLPPASFHVNRAATGALPSAGRPAGPPESPQMSRLPPSPPPPLNSGRRVGLSRPPPLTLDASDGNGAVAAGEEEQNGAHGAVCEDSFAPFSQEFDAAGEFGDHQAGGATVAASG